MSFCVNVLLLLALCWQGGDCLRKFYSRSTTLATFNAAFIQFFPEIEERTEILKEQLLKSKDVDIFCLQEVWQSDTQREIYNAVKEEFPYALSAIDLTSTETSTSGPCSPAQLQQFGGCIATQCPNITAPIELLACLISGCPTVFDGVSNSCRFCFTFARSIEVCANPSASSMFEPTYGLMLLSRLELMNKRAEGYTPESYARGFLQASVKNVGDIVCTHLTSYLGPVYVGPPLIIPLPYETYAEQQYTELLRLFEVLVKMDFPILMGDLNTGPASPGNITWEWPFHYGLLSSRGFYSPYVIQDGRCTWCIDNVAAGASYPFNLIIDHIMIPTDNAQRVLKVKRFLDSVATSNGIPLSDHYGVKITLGNMRRNCKWHRFHQFYNFCPSDREDFRPLPPPAEQLQDFCAPLSD